MKFEEALLTSEAARLLGVTSDAVRHMERRGLLPAVRTGSGVRLFDRATVERLATERAQRRVEKVEAA